MNLSPKQFFQESQKDNSDKLSGLVRSSPMRNAFLFAFTEMASRDHVSKEQLDGAKIYANILMNLGEPDEKPEPFPSKELKHI